MFGDKYWYFTRSMMDDSIPCSSLSNSSANPMDDVRKFLRDLIDPEGFGYSVTSEVRREAMRLLELLK